MKKILLLLITSLVLSCNTEMDPNTRNKNYVCAGANNFAPTCMSDLDWEIITNYNDDQFPKKVSMKFGNVLVLNECTISNSYPFKVNRGALVFLEATDYIRTDREDIEITISNCETNKVILYNEKQTFTSTGRKLTINLRSK